MRVALLTGGGDCPGLNAVIYAAVRKGINHYGDEFIGLSLIHILASFTSPTARRSC